MRLKYRYIFGLILVLLISLYVVAAQGEALFKKFAGTYITGHDFGGGLLRLEIDGTYSANGGSDVTFVFDSGYYRFENGVLHFSITKNTIKGPDNKEFNLLDPKERMEWDHGVDSGEVNKNFDLLPIEWGGRIYLIDEKELKEFADSVNLGIEPRPCLRSDDAAFPWFGSFYLRKGDEKKPVSGIPKLPGLWTDYLLRKPVSAAVIEIREIKEETYGTITIAAIDKGSSAGLKVGMLLFAKNERPSRMEKAEVTSVAKSTAVIRILRNKSAHVGEIFFTKFQPNLDDIKYAIANCRFREKLRENRKF